MPHLSIIVSTIRWWWERRRPPFYMVAALLSFLLENGALCSVSPEVKLRFDVANFSSPNPRENHNCKLHWMHYFSLSRASFVYGWNIGVLHRPYEHQVHNLCEHYFYWPFASFPLSLSPPRYIIFNHGSWKAHPNRLPWPPSWSFVFRCSQGTPRRTEDHPRSLWRNDHLWFTCS